MLLVASGKHLELLLSFDHSFRRKPNDTMMWNENCMGWNGTHGTVEDGIAYSQRVLYSIGVIHAMEK